MRRIWVAISIFVIITTFCIAESYMINNMIDNLYKDIQKVQSLVVDSNFDEAINLSKKIDENWVKEDKNLGIFISHDILDEVEQSLTVLKINLICEEYPDFFAESGRVLAIIQQLKDTELPSLSNIL